MIDNFPTWLIALDYFLGFLMVILILKFILNLFINENSKFRPFQFFTKITLPILNISSKITPNFIVEPIKPIYVAWMIFMIRIYFLPIFLGYNYLGKFAFVFEKKLISTINEITMNIALYLNYGI